MKTHGSAAKEIAVGKKALASKSVGNEAAIRLYTTGEVAKLCGVSFRTVIRWIKRGLLRAHQLPGRGDNRIQEADLQKFLRETGMVSFEAQGGEPPQVLVVDNEIPVANAIQRVLKNAGYRCRTVNDGFRAGAFLASEKPALVTLDLGMPGMNGHEVLKFIRSQPSLGSVKVLVVSAMDRHELDKALRLGADAVIEKPFTNKQLLEGVSSLVPLQTGKDLKERRSL